MRADRASATARLIAAATLLLASDERDHALVPDGAVRWCRALLSGCRADRVLRASAEHPWTRALWRALEHATHPGIVRHFAWRKRWIEQRCRAALDKGFGRVVVVGAGFDTLALRLAPSFPDVSWIEIDHPQTLAAKQRALTRRCAAMPPNLETVALDLAREPWPTAHLHDDRATFVVLEGLLMYLSPDVVTDLLTRCVPSVSTRGVRAVLSCMVRWPDGQAGFRPASRAVNLWLRHRGEPFTWYAGPTELEHIARSAGYAVMSHVHAGADRGDHRGAVLAGENLMEIEVAREGASVGHVQRRLTAPFDQGPS